ncbi:MAG TPA: PLP-dependent transferase [Limnochordia bacterium]|nr:PLP-dependent transferase [Limnochordia bacterium]
MRAPRAPVAACGKPRAGGAGDLLDPTARAGGHRGPFEAWLCIRGMRTLPLRLRQHEASGLEIAAWLEGHPKVRRVIHPGLESHPQHDLARRQMRGMGGLFSFELDADLDGVRRFVNALSLFRIGVSWGGFESLVLPVGAVEAHRKGGRLEPGDLPVGFVRLFIGLEDAEDLRRDLEQALARM